MNKLFILNYRYQYMTKSGLVRESVIKGYLNGKSFDEISKENNIAKGSVFNIVYAWIAQIGVPNIEEIREFSTIIRKAGITIKQCAQSYRFIQILANFGIRDELDSMYISDVTSREKDEKSDDPTITNKEIGGWKNNINLSSRDDFYYFIEFIYNKCKNLGIKPTNVIGWIQDLLDFVSFSSENVANNTTRFERNNDQYNELQNLNTNKKLFSRKSAEMKNEKGTHIPLVSEISGYIKQKKLDVKHLNLYNEKLQEEIRDLDEQKNTVLSNIAHLKRKANLSLTYLNWFNRLKEDLRNNHGIELEKEINNFVKVFIDFKYHNYDAHQIVQEYKQIESLGEEIKSLQGIVDSIIKTRDNTLKEIESLEVRENYSRQSLDVLQELYYAGFERKELKQLRNTIIEIAASNGIEIYDAGKKFLKDVENQYDDILGFEAALQEKKTELKKLEDEELQYKEYLKSKDIVSRSLPYLYKFGVTDEDIINMTDVVIAYFKGDIVFDPNLYSKNMVDGNKLTKVADYWTLFIYEIKNLGNINSQITNQHSYLESIKKEIDELNSQRQKLNEQTLLSVQLLNSLNVQLSSFMESVKQILFSVKDSNRMFILFQPQFFIYVITRGNSKEDKSTNEDE